jgi:PilZ domain-containing protein
MQNLQDSRRHARYHGTLTVKVMGDGTQRFGTIYEISEGGAFLEVSPLPPVGAMVEVTINADGERHRLEAEVRYRAASEVGPRGLEGVGVEWREVGEPARALLSRLLERAQTGKPLRGET